MVLSNALLHGQCGRDRSSNVPWEAFFSWSNELLIFLKGNSTIGKHHLSPHHHLGLLFCLEFLFSPKFGQKYPGPWNWRRGSHLPKWMVGRWFCLLGWPIFRNYVSFREGTCKGPRLWCGCLHFRKFLHLSEKKAATEVRPLFCFSVWYGKNQLVSKDFRQNMFVFPSFSKKRDLENPPQKMNPKFYQGNLSYRYTSYGHLFINFMSRNESNHPTRINYNYITKTNLGCRLGIGRKLVFLLGKHILFEKKTLFTKRIELMYGFGGEFLLMVLVVVWGIFHKYGFSGEQKPLNKMQTSWPLTNQKKFRYTSRLVSKASYVIHFSQYLRRWPFPRVKNTYLWPLETTLGWFCHLQVSQRCREYCQPTDVQWRRSGGSFVEFLTWKKRFQN